MPITSHTADGKNYVLGSGELFFNPFTEAQLNAGLTASTAGEGEIYIGNTPSLSQTTEEDTLEHYDADHGIRTLDDTVSLQVTRSGSFETDNISMRNLGLMVMAANGVGTITQSSATAATYVKTVKRGRFYQIGETGSLPTGVRNISNVVVAKGASFVTNVAAANNWEVDLPTGRIFILAAAADIPDDTEIQITYDVASSTREQVIAGSKPIYGALRFVANNGRGKNRDYYWPAVKLAPDGDMELKGEDWTVIPFSFSTISKGNLASLYIDGRPA